MLFFKDIKDEKFDDAGFKRLYDKECHICSVTVQLIATLENDPALKKETLEQFDISETVYEDLKQGDQCNPELVWQVSRFLKLSDQMSARECPRYKEMNSAPGQT